MITQVINESKKKCVRMKYFFTIQMQGQFANRQQGAHVRAPHIISPRIQL